MVLISGLIASSYRRSYVTRLGARAARDGAERRSTEDGPAVVCYQGIQYFSDPGGRASVVLLRREIHQAYQERPGNILY